MNEDDGVDWVARRVAREAAEAAETERRIEMWRTYLMTKMHDDVLYTVVVERPH